MGSMASQITSLTIVYSAVYSDLRLNIVYSSLSSDTDQRKHQSSVSLAFVRGIHRSPENVSIWWRNHDRRVCAAETAVSPALLSWHVPNFHDHVHSILNTSKHWGRDDILKCIFLTENLWILIKISTKLFPKDPNNNILSLVQIMAWRRLAHICVTRPQWVKVRRVCKLNQGIISPTIFLHIRCKFQFVLIQILISDR